MSYGLEVMDQSGNVTFTTRNTSWSQVGTFFVPANTTVSRSYQSGNKLTEIRTMQTMHSDIPDSQKTTCANITISHGNTVNVTASGNNIDVTVVVVGR